MESVQNRDMVKIQTIGSKFGCILSDKNILWKLTIYALPCLSFSHCVSLAVFRSLRFGRCVWSNHQLRRRFEEVVPFSGAQVLSDLNRGT